MRARHKGGNPADENFDNCILPRAQVTRARHEGGNPSDGDLLN